MARKSVRAQWAAKLAGKESQSLPVDPDMILKRTPFKGIMLGIDPSLRGSGFAVIEFVSDRAGTLLFSETLKLKSKLPMAYCLGNISEAVSGILNKYDVRHVAVEQTIYVQNFQTAQILGAARGAAIAAAAVQGVPVFEYPPLRVKQAVVGFGRASKEQVAKTVQSLLNLQAPLKPDEADAASVALCHAMTYRAE